MMFQRALTLHSSMIWLKLALTIKIENALPSATQAKNAISESLWKSVLS
jgi:hypothetical protein